MLVMGVKGAGVVTHVVVGIFATLCASTTAAAPAICTYRIVLSVHLKETRRHNTNKIVLIL